MRKVVFSGRAWTIVRRQPDSSVDYLLCRTPQGEAVPLFTEESLATAFLARAGHEVNGFLDGCEPLMLDGCRIMAAFLMDRVKEASVTLVAANPTPNGSDCGDIPIKAVIDAFMKRVNS